MQNLLNPKWLYIINTIPLVVLFFLFVGQFNIIHSLLDDKSIQLWILYGIALGFLGVLNIAYAVSSTMKKESVSISYAFLILSCYIPLLYFYGYHVDQLIPFSIPRWMVSSNFVMYVGTFLMPTLAYSLFILVVHFTPEGREHKAGANLLMAIGVPVVGYLFVQIILPLWKFVDYSFYSHTLIVLVITATLAFLFFLIRSIYILIISKDRRWQINPLLWKIPISIVLPLVGLVVNNGLLFIDFGSSHTGIFGNFNSIWFYILAVVNGLLICMPNLDNKEYRLFLYFGKCITFSYTLYFFMVFLPFLPLSVVAIIAIGSGVLMLTPLLLFVIHINDLSKDFEYLQKLYSKKLLIAVCLFGFLIIPACITSNYVKDRGVLHTALTYVYSPNYSIEYDIDTNSLQKTLNVIKGHKNHQSSLNGMFGSGIPYLSSYFTWLVLDNLTLSDSKINTLESIYFDKKSDNSQPDNIINSKVEISKISTRSTYDKNQNAWKSWVDLEITNSNESQRFAEYATTINLPTGCWISDYYLYVGNKKESGILAEKKSAKWVFSQIRRGNRDPGILYYLTGNKVAFRVFPFANGEVRKSGIEFLHKEPIKLNIDNNVIELGTIDETIYESVETDDVIYISAQDKLKLKSVQRNPYFHFLVDVSKDQKSNSVDFIHRIEEVIEANQTLINNAKISFVNTYVQTTLLAEDWKEMYSNQDFNGGFYLDRAIKSTLYNAYADKLDWYPVIVVVTDSIQDAICPLDFSDLAFAFPENDLFFNLDTNGNLRQHSLIKESSKELPNIQNEIRFDDRVLEYKMSNNQYAYLPNNNEPDILLKNDVFVVTEDEVLERNWLSALKIEGKRASHLLHPELSDNEWLSMVKYSFISRIMTPVTSYLVVENEAQKAMLQKKQAQVLSGKKSLDAGEDAQGMNEPSLFLLALLLGFMIWYRDQRNKSRIEICNS